MYIFTGVVTSGLSNKVLFFRCGLKWLFVNPRLVSISVLLELESKRTFLGLLLASSFNDSFCGLLRLLTDEEEFDVEMRAFD